MKRNRFNAVLAVLVGLLAAVPLVCATPTILWEDFDDGSGIGAFAPSFIHALGPLPSNDTGIFNWDFFEAIPGDPCLYVDSGTQDYITFVLAPGQYVSHASVSHLEYNGTISFVGLNGRIDESYPGWLSSDWATTEADMSTIGPIQGIILSGDTIFDDIRITVVPEPVTWLLFLVGMVVILCKQNHRAFKSIGTTE